MFRAKIYIFFLTSSQSADHETHVFLALNTTTEPRCTSEQPVAPVLKYFVRRFVPVSTFCLRLDNNWNTTMWSADSHTCFWVFHSTFFARIRFVYVRVTIEKHVPLKSNTTETSHICSGILYSTFYIVCLHVLTITWSRSTRLALIEFNNDGTRSQPHIFWSTRRFVPKCSLFTSWRQFQLITFRLRFRS